MPTAAVTNAMLDAVVRWIAARADTLPTPCYVYDEARLEAACSALSALYPGARVLYSLKANPQPGIVRSLHRFGAGAEVGSEAEYEAAKSAGVAPRDIVVGGISRTRDFIAAACRDGAGAYVIESPRDIALLPGGSRIPVIVRIRPVFGAANAADPAGWFGFEMAEAIAVIRDLERRGVQWAGVHFHAGTQRLDARLVAEAVERLMSGLRELRAAGLRPGIVNFGPGLGVPYRADDRSIDEDALVPVFARLRDEVGEAAVWLEAGRWLVAGAGVYVSRVVNVKRVGGKPHAFVDGGINVHNPGIGLGRMLHANPRFVFPGAPDSAPTSPVQLVGSLCTSADLLGRDVAAPELREGDLVAVANSGAYCATSGMWGFNSRPLFTEILLAKDGTSVTLAPQHARAAAS
jgi:diaminopimelate decarboxylase